MPTTHCKMAKPKKSEILCSHSRSRTTDPEEQDKQTFVYNHVDMADPVFSQEK